MLYVLMAMLVAVGSAATIFALLPHRNREFFRKDNPQPVEAFFGAATEGWFSKWAERYRQTGGKFQKETTPGKVVLIIALVSAPIGALFAFPIGIFILPTIIIAGAWGFFGMQAGKRADKVSIQLAEFVDNMRTALGRGATMEKALRQSIPLSEEPLRHDLLGVAEDLDLGYSITDALKRLSQRAKSRPMMVACANLSLAVTASQEPATQNLRELSKLIRANNETLRDIKAETTLVRAAKNMFIVLPLAMLFLSWLYFGSEAFMTPIGFAAVAFELVISVGGAIAGKKADAWVSKGAI